MRLLQAIRVFGTLKRAQKPHWEQGNYWLLFSFIGGLLPLWGGALLLWLLSSNLSPEKFVDHGEFAIYSAGVLAPAVFVVVREYKAPFPERAVWGAFTVTLLIVALLFFAAATAPEAAPNASLSVNRVALRVLTPVLYVVSVSVAYFLAVIREALTPEPPLDKIHTAGRLEEGFEKLPE